MSSPTPAELAAMRYAGTLPGSPSTPRYLATMPPTEDGWYRSSEATILKPKLRIGFPTILTLTLLFLSLLFVVPFVVLGIPVPDWGIAALPALLLPLGTIFRMTFRNAGPRTAKGSSAEFIEIHEMQLAPGQEGMARMMRPYGDGAYFAVALVEREWIAGTGAESEIRRIPLTPVDYDHGIQSVRYRIPNDGTPSYESPGYRHSWGIAVEGTRNKRPERYFYPLWVSR